MPLYRFGVRGGVTARPCAGKQRAGREAWGPKVSKVEGMASKSLSSSWEAIPPNLGSGKVPWILSVTPSSYSASFLGVCFMLTFHFASFWDKVSPRWHYWYPGQDNSLLLGKGECAGSGGWASWPVHCRMFTSISGLSPLDARSPPCQDNQKCPQTGSDVPSGAKPLQLRMPVLGQVLPRFSVLGLLSALRYARWCLVSDL